MNIGIIDLGFSNVNSIVKAIELKGINPRIIKKQEDWLDDGKVEKIIFPGVGSFMNAMTRLEETKLDSFIKNYCINGGHYLGICLGMQILCDVGFEGGRTNGLGFIPGAVEKIIPALPVERIPHNGWNEVNWVSNSISIRSEILDGKNFYFNHSYSVVTDKEYVIAKTPYGEQGVIAAFNKLNTYGVQFHPEKSQAAGLKLIDNFLKIA